MWRVERGAIPEPIAVHQRKMITVAIIIITAFILSILCVLTQFSTNNCEKTPEKATRKEERFLFTNGSITRLYCFQVYVG